MEDETERPQRREYQNYRSTASFNWRVKDDSPRAESPQQPQQRGERRPPRGDAQGTGYPPRRNYQDRERSEIPTEVTSPRLYVGNLHYTAQSADIESLFANNGFQIAHCTMSIDPMSGRNPGYCFVDMESVDDAKAAMQQLNGMDVLGRSLKVNPGVPKKDGGDGAGLRVNRRPVESWGGGNRGSTDSGSKPTFDRWNRNDASSHFTEPQEQRRRLYIGGLPRMEPQSEVDAEMQKVFASLGIEITAVSKIVSPHPSKAGEPGDHFYLFVDVANEGDVDAAIQALNGTASPWSSTGGTLRVNRAKNNEGRKVIREQRPRRDDGAYGENDRL